MRACSRRSASCASWRAATPTSPTATSTRGRGWPSSATSWRRRSGRPGPGWRGRRSAGASSTACAASRRLCWRVSKGSPVASRAEPASSPSGSDGSPTSSISSTAAPIRCSPAGRSATFAACWSARWRAGCSSRSVPASIPGTAPEPRTAASTSRRSAGEAVQAVYPGSVAFAAPFEGYGPTVVLQHAGGVFTLYAGLGRLQVAKGDVVALRQALGEAADRLYFEIRVDNRPEDPLAWTRR